MFKHDTQVNGQEVQAFLNSIGSNATQTPLDFAIVVSWKSLIRSLFPKEVDGNILNLVHLSNSYTRIVNNNEPMNDDSQAGTAATGGTGGTDTGTLLFENVAVEGTFKILKS